MKRKELLAVLLTGVMALSALVMGCGADDASKTNGGASGEKQTITVALQAHQTVTDYENNYLTNWLEEKMNIEIEFVMLPVASADAKTKVSLLLAEGKDVPDVFLGALNVASAQQYGEEGYFVDLQDYVYDSEKMPYLSALLSENETLKDTFEKSLRNADGTIYGVGRLLDSTYEYNYMNMINKTWLDYLGLEIPTNLEELKEVLIAFRDGDPNQNGIKDEMPLYATINSGVGRCTLDQIINCFTYWGGNRDDNECLGVKDGVVYAEFTTDEYREALSYLNDLYEEKLIPDNVFTDTQEQWKANSKLEPNVVGFQTAASYTDVYAAEMVAMPLLDGVYGEAYTPHIVDTFDVQMAISADTDNLDLCLKFVDMFYEEECSIISRYGEEDVHWTRNVDKMIEAGADAQYKDKLANYDFALLCDLWQENHNGNWRGIQGYYIGQRFTKLELYGENIEAANQELAGEVPYTIDDYQEDNYYGRMPEEVLPALKYTSDEVNEATELMNSINEHIWLTLTQFIKGNRDIDNDSDWKQYLAEMENLGLSRYIELAQTSYNRMK